MAGPIALTMPLAFVGAGPSSSVISDLKTFCKACFIRVFNHSSFQTNSGGAMLLHGQGMAPRPRHWVDLDRLPHTMAFLACEEFAHIIKDTHFPQS